MLLSSFTGRVSAGLRRHQGRGQGPSPPTQLPSGARPPCPLRRLQNFLHRPQALWPARRIPPSPAVGNEYSARPQQVEAALLELEILNSWVQDTSSQLRFPLHPRKEPEAGAGPPGRGLWGPGTVGQGGPHRRAGLAAPGNRGAGPWPQEHMQGPPAPMNKGTHSRRPTLSPLWATGAHAAPPATQALGLSSSVWLLHRHPQGKSRLPEPFAIATHTDKEHTAQVRQSQDRDVCSHPQQAHRPSPCSDPAVGTRKGRGLARGVTTTVYRCLPTASELGDGIAWPSGAWRSPRRNPRQNRAASPGASPCPKAPQ